MSGFWLIRHTWTNEGGVSSLRRKLAPLGMAEFLRYRRPSGSLRGRSDGAWLSCQRRINSLPIVSAARAWRPQGEPEEVRVHDFLIAELGRAAPHSVYDHATNAGWVGVTADDGGSNGSRLRLWKIDL